MRKTYYLKFTVIPEDTRIRTYTTKSELNEALALVLSRSDVSNVQWFSYRGDELIDSVFVR